MYAHAIFVKYVAVPVVKLHNYSYTLIWLALVNNNYHWSSSVAPDDYTAVVQVLQFSVGDSRECFTVDITQNDLCENNEDFFANLEFRSGIEPIIVAPERANVLIDEPECGESIIIIIIVNHFIARDLMKQFKNLSYWGHHSNNKSLP